MPKLDIELFANKYVLEQDPLQVTPISDKVGQSSQPNILDTPQPKDKYFKREFLETQ